MSNPFMDDASVFQTLSLNGMDLGDFLKNENIFSTIWQVSYWLVKKYKFPIPKVNILVALSHHLNKKIP
jgi:hypothetical protein